MQLPPHFIRTKEMTAADSGLVEGVEIVQQDVHAPS